MGLRIYRALRPARQVLNNEFTLSFLSDTAKVQPAEAQINFVERR